MSDAFDNTPEDGGQAEGQPSGADQGDAKPADYAVGYGRPPAHTRFRKGISGNPRGRKRGARNFETLLAEQCDAKISVKEGGKTRVRTKLETVAAQLVNKSAGADLKAISILLAALDRTQARQERAARDPDKDNGSDLGESDQQVFERLLQRMSQKDGIDDQADAA